MNISTMRYISPFVTRERKATININAICLLSGVMYIRVWRQVCQRTRDHGNGRISLKFKVYILLGFCSEIN